ncbi:hypothetical protein [uncultured Nocardioides sp.]|uniref:hypothetical protein n=1 Tax=uncultured Nocardioides sp. TaxID=198441 RepID=UPI002625277E|nr:hypothetical protein [uncultured Nocardioides sp.]
MTVLDLGLPFLDEPRVVVPAPDAGPGNWSGAASAVLVEGVTYLTYRVRRPLTEGRGVAVVVAASVDGISFETVCEVERDEFGAESFERPVVLRRPDGGWRLYLSCATPDSKHWWVEALDADTVEDLPRGRRTLVLPGDDTVGVKDPVVHVDPDGGWHLWSCDHPLDEAGEEDRMTTSYHSSTDGLSWTRHGTVLAPRPGMWDARGARVTAVVSLDPLVVLYDGRPRKEDNWHERCGVAVGEPGAGPASVLTSRTTEPLASRDSDGAWRYAATVRLPDGRLRCYAEIARPDGAHDLVTGLLSGW